MRYAAQISRDWSFGAIRIFIYQDDGTSTKMLRMAPDGERQWEDFDQYRNDVLPTLSINQREAKEVLSSLAEQLAQLGYGTPDAGPIIRAHEKHIESLKAELDRLERVTNGIAIVATKAIK